MENVDILVLPINRRLPDVIKLLLVYIYLGFKGNTIITWKNKNYGTDKYSNVRTLAPTLNHMLPILKWRAIIIWVKVPN